MKKIWRYNWAKSRKYQQELAKRVVGSLVATGLILGLMSAAWANPADGIITDKNANHYNIIGGSTAYVSGFVAPDQTETAAGVQAAVVNINLDNVAGEIGSVSSFANHADTPRYGVGTTIFLTGSSKIQAGLVGYIVNSINSSSPSYSGLVTGGSNHYASVDELPGYNTIALLLFIITIVGLQVAIIAMQLAW